MVNNYIRKHVLTTDKYKIKRDNYLRALREGKKLRKIAQNQWKNYFNDIQFIKPKYPHLKGKDDYKKVIKGDKVFRSSRKGLYKIEKFDINTHYKFKR